MFDGCDRFAYQEGDDAKQVMRVQLRIDSGKAEMMRACAHGHPSSFVYADKICTKLSMSSITAVEM